MKRSLLIALPALLAACASAPSGPVVPVAPSVRVTEFESRLITPAVIKFRAKIEIKNRMRAPLDIADVQWGADLHDRPLFDESFTELHPMSSRGTQWVTLPFQIARADITNQVEDVLAEESLRVRFRGVVHPDGFGPVPFEATRVIPIPKLPEITLDGVSGDPLDGEFTVLLGVRNRNDFPLTFSRVDTFVDLNDRRYDLLRTDTQSHVEPGATGRLRLTMRQTRGKGLSVLINVMKNQSMDFTVGGSIACQTPYGTLLLPVELGSSTGRGAGSRLQAGG